MSIRISMPKCFHQCKRGRLLDSGLLVFIDVNPWRVILENDVNP
jgi:hypothetical protein